MYYLYTNRNSANKHMHIVTGNPIVRPAIINKNTPTTHCFNNLPDLLFGFGTLKFLFKLFSYSLNFFPKFPLISSILLKSSLPHL